MDLLFASSGIEREVIATAEPIEVLTGIIVPTARASHLIAMKVLSESDDRVKDREDLSKLFGAADATDLEEVRKLLDLMETRGFAQGKDLGRVLARYFESDESK